MNEQKKIKINFVGLVSILTFIVVGIGSTFAFFTANSIGESDEYISVTSLEVILNLKIAPLYNGNPLLPTNDKDIERAYKNKCLDSVGAGACIAYTIQLENKGLAQSGLATFSATSEKINNLKYMIVTPGEDYEILKGPTKAINPSTEEQLEGGVPIELSKEDNKEIVIIVWLSNLNIPQDEEQGGYFEGQVSFTSTSGAKITGTMTENVLLGKK